MTTPEPRGAANAWQSAMRAALDAEAEPLAPEDLEAMRRTVVAAARDSAPERPLWRPLVIAATLLLMMGVGGAAGRRFEARPPAPAPQSSSPAAGEQLQLQFATPGGTRIIWVFNSELDLKATP
jgi:ferric-dicitrate binding protein FerR (iron transport regulator)